MYFNINCATCLFTRQLQQLIIEHNEPSEQVLQRLTVLLTNYRSFHGKVKETQENSFYTRSIHSYYRISIYKRKINLIDLIH